MRRLLTSSVLALSVGVGPAFAQAPVAFPDDQPASMEFMEDPEIKNLADREIDPNDDLIRLLNEAARKGPIFRMSPEAFSLRVKPGETLSQTMSILNRGDTEGHIGDLKLVGSFDGLSLTTTCAEPIEIGGLCEVVVTYVAGEERSVSTAIFGSTDARDDKTLSIPVSIEVIAPPKPVEEPAVVDPKAEEPKPVVVIPQPPIQAAPNSRDIARAYLGQMPGGMATFVAPERGFTIVSAPKSPESEEIAGTAYRDIRTEVVTTDERFQDVIDTTYASLPVNRDKILTSDRVIKAVLETPVSNVMCNKTVALVESDVYSATSAKPLIQAGSRVIGECKQFVDERVGIAWERIITVDGRSIVFENVVADTNDAMGLGGALGRVYSSSFDRYVLPIFSTMIDTAAGVIFAAFGEDEEVVTDDNGNVIQEKSAKNEGIRIVTGEARSTAQQIIKDIQDVRKIAVIPAGSRIDIEINEDIVFDDERRVVRVADMTFNLDKIERGEARRDLPENLKLVPADADYKGPFVEINGRRYKVEADRSKEEEASPFAPEISAETEKVLKDLSSKE